MPDVTIAKIAVSGIPFRLDRPFDYAIPMDLTAKVQPGVRVEVPFTRANRRTEGIVLALAPIGAYEKLKPISDVLDESPILTPAQIKLALWMHERFFCTVYEAVKAMLPAGLWFKNGKRRVSDKYVTMAALAVPTEEAAEAAELKRRRAPQQSELLRTLCAIGRAALPDLREFTGASLQSVRALHDAGLISLEDVPVYRRPETPAGEKAPLPELNSEQSKAFKGILKLADGKKAAGALLFGVTGSGKTTIYIRLIAEMRRRGKTAILLVPEIALTPQMLRTFSSHFGDDIAVLHSSLSAGERLDEWRRIKNGEAGVVIGTRSAIFAPAEDLGIIIIDEEQEDSYKSENAPRYHARDVAKFRCAQDNALLLLGSATPDVESRWQAEQGRYAYFTLPRRFNEQAMPSVEIVDMKRELRRGNGSSISERLRSEISENLERGEQSILFLNRRGANKLITCVDCGFTYSCPNCSVSLTYHSFNRRLMCHHCGYTQRLDEHCPECGGTLKYVGTGTQKLEEELHELFPDTPVLRMDTDTVAPAGGHDVLLERFRTERIPIMVGTQMVTKGLNFENVTLVGVISADQSLYAGDYRATERTFSLITQVVGRSGRFEKPGRAVIQTFTPENETIRQAARQDYDSFYHAEIELRRLQALPPFTELLCITMSGREESLVLGCAAKARDELLDATRSEDGVRVLGPAPLSVLRVNNNYRYRVTLCAPPGRGLRRLVADIVARYSSDKQFRGVSVYADTNPSD
ncbi:MAG: replication restart helicase PriA [Candidatus Scatomorpha sp.]